MTTIDTAAAIEHPEQFVAEALERRAMRGHLLHDDRLMAREILSYNNLDFSRGDQLTIAALIALAEGEGAEAGQYLDAMTSRNSQWRHGIRAQAGSRIFGYLDRQGRM